MADKKKTPADRPSIPNATWRLTIALHVEGQDEPVHESSLSYADSYVAQSARNTAELIAGRMNEIAPKYLPNKRGRK